MRSNLEESEAIHNQSRQTTVSQNLLRHFFLEFELGNIRS